MLKTRSTFNGEITENYCNICKINKINFNDDVCIDCVSSSNKLGNYQFVFQFKNIERYIYVEWQHKHLLEFAIYEPKRIQKLSNRELLNELFDIYFDEIGSSYDGCLYQITSISIKEELEDRLSDWLKQ